MKKCFLLCASAIVAAVSFAQIEGFEMPLTSTELPSSKTLKQYAGQIDLADSVFDLRNQKLYFTGLSPKDKFISKLSDGTPMLMAIKIDDNARIVEYAPIEVGYYTVKNVYYLRSDAEAILAKLNTYTWPKKPLLFVTPNSNEAEMKHDRNWAIGSIERSLEFWAPKDGVKDIHEIMYEIVDENGNSYLFHRERDGGQDISDSNSKSKVKAFVSMFVGANSNTDPNGNKGHFRFVVISDFVSVASFEKIKSELINIEYYFGDINNPFSQARTISDFVTKTSYKYEAPRMKGVKVGLNGKQFLCTFSASEGNPEITLPVYNFAKLNVTLGIIDGVDYIYEVRGFAFQYKYQIYTYAYNGHDLDSVQCLYQTVVKEHNEADQRAKDKRKSDMIRKYGENFGTKIANYEVDLGMSKEMCIEAMGQFHQTYKKSDAHGQKETWVYSQWFESTNGLLPIWVITFMNDKITEIREYKDYNFLKDY